MPMGPFRLNDLVGSDIGLHVGKNFVDSFAERVYVSAIIPLLNQHKRLGEKTGKGFYKVRARREHTVMWLPRSLELVSSFLAIFALDCVVVLLNVVIRNVYAPPPCCSINGIMFRAGRLQCLCDGPLQKKEPSGHCMHDHRAVGAGTCCKT